MGGLTRGEDSARWNRRILFVMPPVLVIAVSLLIWRRHDLVAPDSSHGPGLPRVEFILRGSIYDLGYNYRHYLGYRATASRSGDVFDCRIHDGVSTTAFQEHVQNFCRLGAKLVFSTDDTYRRICRQLAEENPEVRFMQFTARPKWMARQGPANFSTYGIRDWEGAYVCGVLAGRAVPEASSFGLVAPNPGAPTVWIANAFALGCQSVNPDIRVEVFYTDSWHDPDKEIAAVKAMTDRQVSAAYFLTNFPATAFKAAEESGLYVLSHYSDLSSFAPSYWMSGCLWHWSSLYDQVTQQVLSGQWKAGAYWGGFKERYIGLGPFGPDVPGSAMQAAKEAIDRIVSGRVSVFSGPVYDNQATLRIPEGSSLSDSEILSCQWLARGVSEFKVTEETVEPLN